VSPKPQKGRVTADDIVEDFLFGEGIKFLRLDGDVPQAQRQKDMDAFNAPDSEYFIFLLTTRAGGVGINLATADTGEIAAVSCESLAHGSHRVRPGLQSTSGLAGESAILVMTGLADDQAIARSHRYGQKKRVLVFKLMTKNSVEGKAARRDRSAG